MEIVKIFIIMDKVTEKTVKIVTFVTELKHHSREYGRD